MLNSKHLSLVNKIGDETEFTNTVNFRAETELTIPTICTVDSGNSKLGFVTNFVY